MAVVRYWTVTISGCGMDMRLQARNVRLIIPKLPPIESPLREICRGTSFCCIPSIVQKNRHVFGIIPSLVWERVAEARLPYTIGLTGTRVLTYSVMVALVPPNVNSRICSQDDSFFNLSHARQSPHGNWLKVPLNRLP